MDGMLRVGANTWRVSVEVSLDCKVARGGEN